jgi:hypothetical protein
VVRFQGAKKGNKEAQALDSCERRFLRSRGHAHYTRVSSTGVVTVIQIWYALSVFLSVHSRASICGCVCLERAMPVLFSRR